MAHWKGEDIIEIARPHLGEKYVFGARAQLTNPNYRGPWDCAEFATWCAYQAYDLVFGASNKNPRKADPYSGQWYVDGKNENALIAAEEALQTPGAIIGRRPNSMDIEVGHVAISLGGGQTIEARGKRYGVVTVDSANRPWNFGVLIPGVEYQRSGSVFINRNPGDRILRVETPFMRGPDIRCAQEALRALGIDPGKIDGIYGDNTANAMRNFQISEGLTVDAEVGPETARELGLGWPIDPNCPGVTVSGPGTTSYTVVAGDSMSAIASRYGLDLDALMVLNPLVANPNNIQVGQKLNVPGGAAPGRGAATVTGYTSEELEALAKTVYGEARGEPQVGQEAVAFVVLNRIKKQSWWGKDIIGVCKYPWQFSCWNRNDPNSATLNTMSGNDSRLIPFLDVARRVLIGQVQNPIGNATHYYADYIAAPSWVSAGTFVTQLGRHRFYADVS
jgi:peptidoglycan hydrolase-like protein with peptidoglycan-binding domain